MSLLHRAAMRKVQFDENPRLYTPNGVMTDPQNHHFRHRHESEPIHHGPGLLNEFEKSSHNAGIGRAQSDLAHTTDQQEFKRYTTTWSWHRNRGEESITIKCDKCRKILFKIGQGYFDSAINNIATPRSSTQPRNDLSNGSDTSLHARDHQDPLPHSSLNQMETANRSSDDSVANAFYNGHYFGNGDGSEPASRLETLEELSSDEHIGRIGPDANVTEHITETQPQPREDTDLDIGLAEATDRIDGPSEASELPERHQRIRDPQPKRSWMRKFIERIKNFRIDSKDSSTSRRQGLTSNASKGNTSRDTPTKDQMKNKLIENSSGRFGNPSGSTNTSIRVQGSESVGEPDFAPSNKPARALVGSKTSVREPSKSDSRTESRSINPSAMSPYGYYGCACQCCSNCACNHASPSAGSMSVQAPELPDSGHSGSPAGGPSLPELWCIGGSFHSSSRPRNDSPSESHTGLHRRDSQEPLHHSPLGHDESETNDFYYRQYFGTVSSGGDSPRNSSEEGRYCATPQSIHDDNDQRDTR